VVSPTRGLEPRNPNRLEKILQDPLHVLLNLGSGGTFRDEREVDCRLPSTVSLPSEFEIVGLLDERWFVDEVLLRKFVENLHHDGVEVFGVGHVVESSSIGAPTTSDLIFLYSYYSIVEPIMSQALVAVDTRITERCVFITTESKDCLIHLFCIEHLELY